VNSESGLNFAVLAGLPDMAELMIQNGAYTQPEDYYKNGKAYPLRTAVERLPDGSPIVEILMKHGFKAEYPVDSANPNWGFDSALAWALLEHHYKTAKNLTQYGARTDIEVRVTYGEEETLNGTFINKMGTLAERYWNDPDALDAIGYRKDVIDHTRDAAHDAAMFVTVPFRVLKYLFGKP